MSISPPTRRLPVMLDTPRARSRAGVALIVLLAAGAGLWWETVHVAHAASLDYRLLNGVSGLATPGSYDVAEAITHIVNPAPFVVLAGLVLATPSRRREWWTVGAILVLLVGANVSTEVLKHVLPGRPVLPLGPVTSPTRSFPSGHATAAMSLTLAATLGIDPRFRPAAVRVGLLVTMLIGAGLVFVGAHYPSDVIGGFGMALAWALLIVSASPYGLTEGARRRRSAGAPRP